MASLTLTLENDKNALKIVGNVVSGWKRSALGYTFRGLNSLDYVNDTRLVVSLTVKPPNRSAHSVAEFPTILKARHGDSSLYYDLESPRLEVLVDMRKHFGKLWKSEKPGIHWQAAAPIKYGPISFWLTLLAYVERRQRSSAKIVWEYDVLPFLPGGQFESKR